MAVLGHALWESRFGGAPSIVGRTVRIDGKAYTVIGVARSGFTGVKLERVDVWLPMSLSQHSPNWATSWEVQWLQVVARAVAMLACALPARRAAAVDPARLLRGDRPAAREPGRGGEPPGGSRLTASTWDARHRPTPW